MWILQPCIDKGSQMEPSKRNTICPIIQANNTSQEKFYSSTPKQKTPGSNPKGHQEKYHIDDVIITTTKGSQPEANTVVLEENVIQVAKRQSSVATKCTFPKYFCVITELKREFLATLNSFRCMHSDHITRRMRKSVDSALLGRSDWKNNNP